MISLDGLVVYLKEKIAEDKNTKAGFILFALAPKKQNSRDANIVLRDANILGGTAFASFGCSPCALHKRHAPG